MSHISHEQSKCVAVGQRYLFTPIESCLCWPCLALTRRLEKQTVKMQCQRTRRNVEQLRLEVSDLKDKLHIYKLEQTSGWRELSKYASLHAYPVYFRLAGDDG